MKIILNHSSMIPIYEQLVSQVKAGIVSGELAPGSVLPSVRSLAAELAISALTVKKAYDRLEEEGVIVTVHGKGSFVADNNGTLIAETSQRETEALFAEAIERARASGMSREEIKALIDIILEA